MHDSTKQDATGLDSSTMCGLQVSWDWCLESTVVFKAVSYLDHFLACNTMPLLSK